MNLRHWAGSGGALRSQWTPLSPRLFAWQAWRLATSTCILRGRRGAWQRRRAFYVAAVVLGDVDLHFAWRVWRLWRWSGCGGFCRAHTHTTLSHTTLTQLCRTHTHNSFTHSSFTHNFVTYISFTHNLLHTTLSHTTLSHTTLLHTQTYTHTHTHNTVTYSSFTQPVLHHLLSFLPFPSHFHICLVIIGRS